MESQIQTFRAYLKEFNDPSPVFYQKWRIMIELVTGVDISGFDDLHKYATANTAAMLIRRYV